MGHGSLDKAVFTDRQIKPNLYEKFKKYEVEAPDLADFCKRYHKAGAWHNRPDDYREADYNGHLNDLVKYGYTIIPHHDSVTGEIVSYYGELATR